MKRQAENFHVVVGMTRLIKIKLPAEMLSPSVIKHLALAGVNEMVPVDLRLYLGAEFTEMRSARYLASDTRVQRNLLLPKTVVSHFK